MVSSESALKGREGGREGGLIGPRVAAHSAAAAEPYDALCGTPASEEGVRARRVHHTLQRSKRLLLRLEGKREGGVSAG